MIASFKVFKAENKGVDFEEELFKARWAKGFLCSECGSTRGCRLKCRKVTECNDCSHQASPTTGTFLHSTKLPLVIWFYVVQLGGFLHAISGYTLARECDIHWRTARAIKRRIERIRPENILDNQLYAAMQGVGNEV